MNNCSKAQSAAKLCFGRKGDFADWPDGQTDGRTTGSRVLDNPTFVSLAGYSSSGQPRKS